MTTTRVLLGLMAIFTAPALAQKQQVGSVEVTGYSEITLTKEQAGARTALKAAAEADVTLLALLAEIDQGLGLLREAREEFRVAAAREPENASLGSALARLDQWMDDRPR